MTPEEWLNPAFDLTEAVRTLSRVGAATLPGVLRDTERWRLALGLSHWQAA